MLNFFGRTCFLAFYLRKVGFELLRFKSRGLTLLLQRLFDSDSHSDGSADHGVVAHAQEAHHFYVRRDGGRTCKLRVGVHAAHGIGHAVGSGTCGHVVRMQRAARAAAGGDGEVLLALLDALFLISAGNGMLEAGRVGGVAGDGNIDALMVHDGHALADIVSAVAADVGTLALGVADLADDVQLARVVVKLGLHIGEAVDAGDDLGGVLAEAVQDDAQRRLAGLIGVADDADRAFGSREGLVAGQERKALGLLAQQHRAEVTVAEADLAVVRDGAVDAEGLKALADLLGGFGSGGNTGLQRDGRADGVSPAGILEADGLNALDDLIGVEALRLADLAALLDGTDAVLCEDTVDLIDSSFVAFKQSHVAILLIPDAGRCTWRRCQTDHSGPSPFPSLRRRRCPS